MCLRPLRTKPCPQILHWYIFASGFSWSSYLCAALAACRRFDWCTRSKDSRVPAECYNRLSGVLFTDDKFEVSTNKLHFMELELKLKDKSAIFTRIVNGQVAINNCNRAYTYSIKKLHDDSAIAVDVRY